MRNRHLWIMVGITLIAAGVVGCEKKNEETEVKEETEREITAVTEDEMQLIETASLGEDVVFVDYTAGATDIQIMLFKDEQDIVHGAFNTCQVCNGSPYAYFEQEGNDVVCQNCGNHFSVSEIGAAHGGCNPVPLEFEQDGDAVKISTSYLDENAGLFVNWKKGI